MIEPLLNSPPIRTAYGISKNLHQELYLVGGALRDLYLKGSISTDIDFLVERDAQPIARHFAQTHKGTFFCLDVTRGNYRALIHQEGEDYTIDFSPLREGQIARDLVSRDFTINSIAVRLSDLFETGEYFVIDPTGGMDDLSRKVIRVSSPYSFEHDPVRMLRAIRFSHYCTFRLDAHTERLMSACRERLLLSPWERIRNEFFIILEQSEASRALTELDRLGLLFLLMPELETMKGVGQGAHLDYTLWDHVLRTVYCTEGIIRNASTCFPGHGETIEDYCAEKLENTIQRGALIKFAALLHDIGKPSRRTETGNQVQFIGHDKAGMTITLDIAKRFKLGTKTSQLLTFAVRNHMRILTLHQLESVTERARYRLIRDLSPAVVDTLILTLADAMATRRSSLDEPGSSPLYQTVLDMLDYYSTAYVRERPQALLNGHDIMEAFSLKPGKKVGRLLEIVRQAEREGRVGTPEEAMKLIAREMSS